METLISWGLSVIGIVLVANVLIPALSNGVAYPAARLMITNLLRTNPRSAQVACTAGKGSFLEAIGEAIKIGAQMGGTRDPAIITKATLPSYDAAASVVMQRWKGYMLKAKMGAGAAAGAVILKYQKTEEIPWLFTIIALLVAAAYGFLFWRMNEVERGTVLARREVLPEVDRMFVDGRYY